MPKKLVRKIQRATRSYAGPRVGKGAKSLSKKTSVGKQTRLRVAVKIKGIRSLKKKDPHTPSKYKRGLNSLF